MAYRKPQEKFDRELQMHRSSLLNKDPFICSVQHTFYIAWNRSKVFNLKTFPLIFCNTQGSVSQNRYTGKYNFTNNQLKHMSITSNLLLDLQISYLLEFVTTCCYMYAYSDPKAYYKPLLRAWIM